jgi:hypothetical protein
MMEGLNADAVLEVEAETNATAASCRWDEAKCCCDVSKVKGNTVVTCKQFTTGIKDGKEVCRCKDVGKKAFGFAGTPHSPNSWKLQWWLFGNDQAMQELQTQCADPSLPFAFQGDRPEGSCTVDRLFSYGTPRWMQGTKCEGEKKSTAIELEEKLASSKLLNSINPLLTRGALMGCAAIGEGCAKLSWTNSIMQKVLSNLDSGLGLGQLARDQILLYATDALVNEAGVDEETAGLLIDWAFHHEEGTNAYCDPELMAQHRDMLVKGLTAAEPNHTVLERPWVYGEEDVYKPFRDLLSFTVEGMFKADCEKPRPPEVAEDQAREGVGLRVLLPEKEKAELQGKIDAAVAKPDFLEAHRLEMKMRSLTAAEPLLPFKDVPLIGTTLEYLQRPVLQHPIEAMEGDVVRSVLGTLGSLLNNKTFASHLKRAGGHLDDWEMPPELDALWAKTRNAKYGERIWEDGLVEKFRTPANSSSLHCNCKEIEPNIGLHMLNMLPDIGLDFGHVVLDADGHLASDKPTATLQHVDLEGFARTMVMVEAGIQDPQLATTYIARKVLRSAEAAGSKTGVPPVSAAGKVKGVLVGMPIVQNLWAMLEQGNGLSTDVFAKKMKWFFVANIVWAVWHAIEKNLPPEDIVLGLLTVVMSTLSSFNYDGKWITFSNSKPFTDYMLAVYTVWNYRFVKQWASEEKPEDQWMHVSVALSMPIVEALANHGDVGYYINYRRDDLFHSMQLMLERQQKAGETVKGRCCCDWDRDPGFWESVVTKLSQNMDREGMINSQRCVVVPSELQRNNKLGNGKCPPVAFSKWVNIEGLKAEFMEWADDKHEYLQLHHDEAGCEDASKVLRLPASAFS